MVYGHYFQCLQKDARKLCFWPLYSPRSHELLSIAAVDNRTSVPAHLSTAESLYELNTAAESLFETIESKIWDNYYRFSESMGSATQNTVIVLVELRSGIENIEYLPSYSGIFTGTKFHERSEHDKIRDEWELKELQGGKRSLELGIEASKRFKPSNESNSNFITAEINVPGIFSVRISLNAYSKPNVRSADALSVLHYPDEWKNAIEANLPFTKTSSGDRNHLLKLSEPVVMVAGSKGSGKSTFCRFLVNALLNQ